MATHHTTHKKASHKNKHVGAHKQTTGYQAPTTSVNHPGGMKLTMSALPKGLTVTADGAALLTQSFVFQCPPMNTFAITKAFTTTNYDTIDNVQFSALVSSQLRQITFDTLVMELGSKSTNPFLGTTQAAKKTATLNAAGLLTAGDALDKNKNTRNVTVAPKNPVTYQQGQHVPTWVPYPAFNNNAQGNPVDPGWYVDQLDDLVNSGAPFMFTAAFPAVLQSGVTVSASQVTPELSCYAQLLSYVETYNAGEGDAIYLSTMTIAEWRDPLQTQRGLSLGGGKTDRLPTSVMIDTNGLVSSGTGTAGFNRSDATLTDLSQFFYHDPNQWKVIAKANNIKGIGQNDPLSGAKIYSKLKGTQTAKIVIPSIGKPGNGGRNATKSAGSAAQHSGDLGT